MQKLFFFFFLVLNCSSAPAYLSDRGMDARDMVDVGYQASYGFAFEVGPYIIAPLGFWGFRNWGLENGEIGSGKASASLFFIPFINTTYSNSIDPKVIERLDFRNKEFCNTFEKMDDYCKETKIYEKKHVYGKLGVRFGIFAGAKFSINFIEIIDFLTGILGYDLLEDDFYYYQSKNKKLFYNEKK